MRSIRYSRVAAMTAALVISGTLLAGAPSYTIHDIGVADPGDFGSQGTRVSASGIATGRSLGTVSRAFRWTESGGLEPLPNLPGRDFCVGNSVNTDGIVVGTGAQTSFGAGALPVLWTQSTVQQLPLPSGFSVGRANGVNDNGIAVGSVGGGISERGVIYGETAELITETTANGSFMTTAFAINNEGLVVGIGSDPNNAARNVGVVYDTATGEAFEVGLIAGANGAIAFGVSEAGHVVGSSSLNQSSPRPFIWSEGLGSVAIPLPVGTSQGGARGVNSQGWVVGTASGVFAVPYVYDGTATYILDDLIPDGSGWDLSTNTSSSAMAINDDGVIVGTGVLNGEVRAYAMFPEPAQDSVADLAEPFGVFDLADIQAFVVRFTAGCP